MPEDRIAKLSQRFRQHTVGRRPENTRRRERRSLYLDGMLMEQLDKTYKAVNHELYPANVSKSVFLETLLEYGLSNLAEIKQSLSQIADTGQTSDES